MPVLLITKNIILSVCGSPPENTCRWFERGDGLIGTVVVDDGTFLTVITRMEENGGEATLPKDAVHIVVCPEVLAKVPPATCQHCGQPHHPTAVWQTHDQKLVCNLCYAIYYHGLPWARFERDLEADWWLKTAPLT